MLGVVGAVGIRGEGRRELVEALAEADLDACNEVRGVDCAVGDPVVNVEVRAGVGGPKAEVDVGGEREAAVGKQRGEPVGEALTGADIVDDSLSAPGDQVGAVGVLSTAVLLDDPPTRLRLEDELGDAEVVGPPPSGEQGGLRQVAPDQLGTPRQRPEKPERAAVGPPRLLRSEPLCVEAEPVAVVGLAPATDLVGGVGEAAEGSRQVPQWSGPEPVDAALARALGDDDAGALKGLQVQRMFVSRNNHRSSRASLGSASLAPGGNAPSQHRTGAHRPLLRFGQAP